MYRPNSRVLDSRALCFSGAGLFATPSIGIRSTGHRIGPLSIMRAMAWRWTSLSLDGCSGDFPFSRLQHPISDDLKPDTANHRRLSAGERCFDNPSLGQEFESNGIGSLHNF